MTINTGNIPSLLIPGKRPGKAGTMSREVPKARPAPKKKPKKKKGKV